MRTMEFHTREGTAEILFRPEIPPAHRDSLLRLKEREFASLNELSDVLYTATAGWGVQCQMLQSPLHPR